MSSTLTNLTAATAWSGTDLFYATIGGNSRKIAASDFFTLSSSILTRSNSSGGTFKPVLELAQTWANSGVVHRALRLTITNTGAAVSSRAMEIVVPNDSSYYGLCVVTVTGDEPPIAAIRGDGSIYGSQFTTSDVLTAGIFQTTVSGTTGISLRSSSSYGFTNAAEWYATQDVQLWRDAASCLAQRTGTTAQTFRVYRTRTDSSNYERLALQTGSGYVELAAETAGTGTDNLDVRLTSAGTGGVKLNGSCGIYVGAGAPSFTATQGSIYLNSTGSSTSTRLYVNTTGSTTWTNVVTAA
jgi:hypothetical protein